MKAADAKTRIVIYGDLNVVSALAKFENAGARLDNKHSILCFLELVNAMRTQKKASNDELSGILMGTKINKKNNFQLQTKN